MEIGHLIETDTITIDHIIMEADHLIEIHKTMEIDHLIETVKMADHLTKKDIITIGNLIEMDKDSQVLEEDHLMKKELKRTSRTLCQQI